jgi:hypothetical protein
MQKGSIKRGLPPIILLFQQQITIEPLLIKEGLGEVLLAPPLTTLTKGTLDGYA